MPGRSKNKLFRRQLALPYLRSKGLSQENGDCEKKKKIRLGWEETELLEMEKTVNEIK